MYKTEIYSNGTLLHIGFGKTLFSSVNNCQYAFIAKTVQNKTNGILTTEFFVVIKKVYFDQFGNLQVKYKKGTYAYCKSQAISVPFMHCNTLSEYIKF